MRGRTLIDEDTVLPAVPLWWRGLEAERAESEIDHLGSASLATDWGTRLLSDWLIVRISSDPGGSLRIPAHACGVSAWKPTWGLVSIAGAMALAPTLDAIGLPDRKGVA